MSLVQSEINRLGYTIEQQRNIITMVSTERDNVKVERDNARKELEEYKRRFGKLN